MRIKITKEVRADISPKTNEDSIPKFRKWEDEEGVKLQETKDGILEKYNLITLGLQVNNCRPNRTLCYMLYFIIPHSVFSLGIHDTTQSWVSCFTHHSFCNSLDYFSP